jgi:signal transduction histidine kinase
MSGGAGALGILPADLERCFPLSIVVDRELHIESVGPALARLLPELSRGGTLGEHFEPVGQPDEPAADALVARAHAALVARAHAALVARAHAALVIRARHQPLVVLRGRLLPLIDERLVFVGALDDASGVDAARLSSELATLNAELEDRVTARTTELELANAQLQRSTWDLAATLAELAETNRTLQREKAERGRIEGELRIAHRLEAVGQLAAGIAHEINTPIQYVGDSLHFLRSAFEDVSPLLSQLESLARTLRAAGEVDTARRIEAAWEVADADFLREQIPRALDRTFDGIERVAGIVRAMKTLAHPGGEDRAPADLNEALRNTLIVTRNEFKYVADIETDLGPIPQVPCQLGEINQVFLNLVVNAAHAVAESVAGSDRRGTIRIRSRTEGDSVVVEIADTGVGIPNALKERVFDPFFTTKPVGKGTGQGLSMARNIVTKHGGTLAFASSPGQGTTFTIRLPLVQPATSCSSP